MVARPTLTGDYTATTRIVESRGADEGVVGIAAYGDPDNAIGISRSGANVLVWMREKGKQRTLATVQVKAGPTLDLRIVATDGRRFRFSYSTDGRDWRTVGEEAEGGYLPPWDRAVRVALAVGGKPGIDGLFDWVRIETR